MWSFLHFCDARLKRVCLFCFCVSSCGWIFLTSCRFVECFGVCHFKGRGIHANANTNTYLNVSKRDRETIPDSGLSDDTLERSKECRRPASPRGFYPREGRVREGRGLPPTLMRSCLVKTVKLELKISKTTPTRCTTGKCACRTTKTLRTRSRRKEKRKSSGREGNDETRYPRSLEKLKVKVKGRKKETG